jgi:hypothetical protein
VVVDIDGDGDVAVDDRLVALKTSLTHFPIFMR